MMTGPQYSSLAGLPTPRIGLGCMGMSEFYGASDDAASLRALHDAFQMGYRHFDTADMYGNGANERLLGSFLRQLGGRRGEVLVATKVGIRRRPGPTPAIDIDSSPAYVRAACEQSLQRLGVERIGLLYLHRRSPGVPVEDTVGAMQDLVREGKVAHLGLSEVSRDTLARACRTAPIAALQSEYSLWTRDVEQGLLQDCAALGVALVAYSPLGRGFLTGAWQPGPPGDLRAHLPRFQPANVAANQALLAALRGVAEEAGGQPAQVALAWLMSRGAHVHAIPGSRSSRNLAANAASAQLALSEAQVRRLDQAFQVDAVHGERYPAALLETVNV
jgi:aryl-alcohol dehydrogenase-like predicted oxidoreductase